MRIINRMNPKPANSIYWRTFKPDDGSHIIGEHDGRLNLNDIINVGSSYGSVQLELKWGGVTNTTLLAASTNRTYNTSHTLVLNDVSSVAVVDDEAKALLILGGWNETSPQNTPQVLSLLPPDFVQVLNVMMALVDGIAVGYASTSVGLGGAKGAVGLASSILGMFSEAGQQPESLGLAEIGNTVQTIINENQARIAAAKVLMVCGWFDRYVQKSASLKQKGELTDDLGDYDKNQFIDELDDHLDGQTDFLGAMADLEHNRNIRKYVIPQYIMGVMLHLNLERLKLVVKRQSTPLDVHDINQSSG